MGSCGHQCAGARGGRGLLGRHPAPGLPWYRIAHTIAFAWFRALRWLHSRMLRVSRCCIKIQYGLYLKSPLAGHYQLPSILICQPELQRAACSSHEGLALSVMIKGPLKLVMPGQRREVYNGCCRICGVSMAAGWPGRA